VWRHFCELKNKTLQGFEGTKCCNSHYETDFGVSIACGDGNTKIDFLKANLWLAFKKPIFIMRISAQNGVAILCFGIKEAESAFFCSLCFFDLAINQRAC